MKRGPDPLEVSCVGPHGPVTRSAKADCRLRSLGPTDWMLKLGDSAPIPFPMHAYRVQRGTRYVLLPGTGTLLLWVQLLGT